MRRRGAPLLVAGRRRLGTWIGAIAGAIRCRWRAIVPRPVRTRRSVAPRPVRVRGAVGHWTIIMGQPIDHRSVVVGGRRDEIDLRRPHHGAKDGAIPNPMSPAATADLGPACAGRVSNCAAIAIAAAVTAVLKTLSIGDPSTRPFDETLRGGPPYGEA